MSRLRRMLSGRIVMKVLLPAILMLVYICFALEYPHMVTNIGVSTLVALATLSVFFYIPLFVLTMQDCKQPQFFSWDRKVLFKQVSGMPQVILDLALLLVLIVVWDITPTDIDLATDTSGLYIKIITFGLFIGVIIDFIQPIVRLVFWVYGAKGRSGGKLDYRTEKRLKYLRQLPVTDLVSTWSHSTWETLSTMSVANSRKIFSTYIEHLEKSRNQTDAFEMLKSLSDNRSKIIFSDVDIYKKILRWCICFHQKTDMVNTDSFFHLHSIELFRNIVKDSMAGYNAGYEELQMIMFEEIEDMSAINRCALIQTIGAAFFSGLEKNDSTQFLYLNLPSSHHITAQSIADKKSFAYGWLRVYGEWIDTRPRTANWPDSGDLFHTRIVRHMIPGVDPYHWSILLTLKYRSLLGRVETLDESVAGYVVHAFVVERSNKIPALEQREPDFWDGFADIKYDKKSVAKRRREVSDICAGSSICPQLLKIKNVLLLEKATRVLRKSGKLTPDQDDSAAGLINFLSNMKKSLQHSKAPKNPVKKTRLTKKSETRSKAQGGGV